MGTVREDAKAPYVPNEAERKLIEALRSGKYQQAFNQLRTEDGFCCLGVAEDVLGDEEWERGPDGRWGKSEGVGGVQTMRLRATTLAKLGWSYASGILDDDVEWDGQRPTYLGNLNDLGCPFSQIADIIEAGKVKRA